MLLPSTLESHDATELGEIDISENSIDGMGAMIFTNEEDCGFFSTPQKRHFLREEGREENIPAANSSRSFIKHCVYALHFSRHIAS